MPDDLPGVPLPRQALALSFATTLAATVAGAFCGLAIVASAVPLVLRGWL